MGKSNFKNILISNYQQILLVFTAFLAMVSVSVFYMSNIVSNQMQSIGSEVMNTTQTSVTGSLSETELIFANAVQTVENMIQTEKSNDDILEYLTQTNNYFDDDRSSLPDFLKLYGYIRGEFLDGSGWIPPSDYSPPSRPWYIGAENNDGKMYFTEPYIDADTGGMCISFSQVLYNDSGKSEGIIAIDLNLSRVTDYVSKQQIANEGYGIMLSDTLHITTHKNDELIEKQMSEISDEYARLEKMLESGEEIIAVRFRDYDGTDSIAYFRQIFNGWYIGIFTPRASYYAQVYEMGIVIVALGFVLMIILSSLLVRNRMDKMRADEESKSKSNFLARMSHEMRTPMNAIIGMTDIAIGTDDPEKIKYSLGKINDAADHLLGVINDVLDMSKIEAGKLELSISDFDLEHMINKTLNVISFKFEEKKQVFTYTMGQDVPKIIKSDEQRLSQVITNLLSNANKFTPEGGAIDFKVECTERSRDKCGLKITVSDTGIGLTKEQQSRLFKSFEQADNSISRKYGGTGLGLSISKRIIELMDGDAIIESELGEGAKFIFTMQAGIGSEQSVQVKEIKKETVNNKDMFKDKYILLAEDVEINREILITLLSETGVTIECAENGQMACDMFASNPNRYELIFMDIHMPEMDGYEAARRIRSMNDISNAGSIPIIAMTADVFREDIERAREAGMNGHVGKPINMDEVLDTMKEYIK